jgi:hypothetical protein
MPLMYQLGVQHFAHEDKSIVPYVSPNPYRHPRTCQSPKLRWEVTLAPEHMKFSTLSNLYGYHTFKIYREIRIHNLSFDDCGY